MSSHVFGHFSVGFQFFFTQITNFGKFKFSRILFRFLCLCLIRICFHQTLKMIQTCPLYLLNFLETFVVTTEYFLLCIEQYRVNIQIKANPMLKQTSTSFKVEYLSFIFVFIELKFEFGHKMFN